MNIHKMLTELKAERELVEEAIVALSRLDAGEKRRGRPPSWMNEGDNLTELKKSGRAPRTKNRSKPKEQD